MVLTDTQVAPHILDRSCILAMMLNWTSDSILALAQEESAWWRLLGPPIVASTGSMMLSMEPHAQCKELHQPAKAVPGMSGFSGVLKLHELSDFIAPSQACVVNLQGSKEPQADARSQVRAI